MAAKRSPKAPLPQGLIWWRDRKRHPLHEALGLEVHWQRARRGWSLDDLSKVTDIAKSHLWDMEHGRHTVSLEMIWRLEIVFLFEPDRLLKLARLRLGDMPGAGSPVRST